MPSKQSPNPTRNRQGLTIIELLIAISLLGLMLAGMAGVMAPIFNTTKSSQTSVSASSRARDVLETIRTDWRTAAKFNNTCAALPTMPNGVVVEVVAKKVVPGNAGNPDTLSSLTFTNSTTAGNCPTSGAALAAGELKRATVRIKNTAGAVLSELSLDMAQP
jgi:prepilin-type N-terminal cleavage/methylation domain-containing protein